MLGWIKHKLESRLLVEMSITLDMQMIPPLWQKEKRNQRASWWRWKSRVKKLAEDSTFKKWRSWHPVPSFMANRWGNNRNRDKIYFLGLQNHCSDYSHEIKGHLLLARKAMINLDSILKYRDITLPTKVYLVKAMDFPVVLFGCESWTIKKAEHWRADAFKLWY